MAFSSLNLFIAASEFGPVFQDVIRANGLFCVSHRWPPHRARRINPDEIPQELAAEDGSSVQILVGRKPFLLEDLSIYYNNACEHSLVVVEAPRQVDGELLSTWIAACSEYFDKQSNQVIATPEFLDIFQLIAGPIKRLLKRPVFLSASGHRASGFAYTDGAAEWSLHGGKLRDFVQRDVYYRIDPP